MPHSDQALFANPAQIDIAYRESGLYTLLTKLDQPFVLREGYGYLTLDTLIISSLFICYFIMGNRKPESRMRRTRRSPAHAFPPRINK